MNSTLTQGGRTVPSGRGQPPSTKKAARALGYRTHDEWVRKSRIPRRDAVPLVVKGTEFYSETDCEDLVSRTRLLAERMYPAPDAEPAATKYLHRASTYYEVFRLSDAVPLPGKKALLDAIRAVTAHAGRLAGPRETDGEASVLRDLMELGIRYACKEKYLWLVGGNASLVFYTDGQCFYRSTSVASRRKRIPEVSAMDVITRYEAEPPGREAPSLQDAVRVLRSIPDCSGFRDIHS